MLLSKDQQNSCPLCGLLILPSIKGKNVIEKIEGFESFLNLRHLHLGWNYISVIEGLNHLKDLEVLYIGNNKIEEITGLEQLTNLKELYLEGNPINSIPDELFQLPELEYITFSRNFLSVDLGFSLLKLEKNGVNVRIH